MKIFLGVVALLIAFSAGAASLDRYKSFLNGTQSARAQFEQKVYDRSGKLTQETRGNFVFQRPGRFRWVYDKPADQVIVGDGSRVWIYDRQLNRSEEHTSELQSRRDLVCRLLLEKKKINI